MNNAAQHEAELDASAAHWGLFARGAETLFKNVPVGARFVWNAEDVSKPYAVMLRTKSGYRHEIGGRVWQTGSRTACHVIAATL